MIVDKVFFPNAAPEVTVRVDEFHLQPRARRDGRHDDRERDRDALAPREHLVQAAKAAKRVFNEFKGLHGLVPRKYDYLTKRDEINTKLSTMLKGDALRELDPVETATLSLARFLAIKGAGEKQALHGICLIMGDGEAILKCGKIKVGSQNLSATQRVVLDKNFKEFSPGAAGDGAIVIDRNGDYLCASFGIGDVALGDETGGGMRHQAASAIAQQAGGCFVIKVSEDACGCKGTRIDDATMDVFDRRKDSRKVAIDRALELALDSALNA